MSVAKNRNINVYTDGGARGNPGTAGTGVVIYDDAGTPIYEATEYLGETTNNQAEYKAFLSAIKKVIAIDPTYVTFHADSELMVKQINGVYKVKSAELKPIYAEAKKLLAKLNQWEVKHVRRNQNSRADELANMAMDSFDSEIVLDVTDSEVIESPESPTNLFDAPSTSNTSKPILKCQLENQSACTHMAKSQKIDDVFELTELAPGGVCLRLLEKILAFKNQGQSKSPAKLSCDDCKTAVVVTEK